MAESVIADRPQSRKQPPRTLVQPVLPTLPSRPRVAEKEISALNGAKSQADELGEAEKVLEKESPPGLRVQTERQKQDDNLEGQEDIHRPQRLISTGPISPVLNLAEDEIESRHSKSTASEISTGTPKVFSVTESASTPASELAQTPENFDDVSKDNTSGVKIPGSAEQPSFAEDRLAQGLHIQEAEHSTPSPSSPVEEPDSTVEPGHDGSPAQSGHESPTGHETEVTSEKDFSNIESQPETSQDVIVPVPAEMSAAFTTPSGAVTDQTVKLEPVPTFSTRRSPSSARAPPSNAHLHQQILSSTPSLLDHLYRAYSLREEADTSVVVKCPSGHDAEIQHTVRCPGLMLSRSYRFRNLLVKRATSTFYIEPFQTVTLESPIFVRQEILDLCIWHLCTDYLPTRELVDSWAEHAMGNGIMIESRAEYALEFSVQCCIAGVIMGLLSISTSGLLIMDACLDWENLEFGIELAFQLCHLPGINACSDQTTFSEYLEGRAFKAANGTVTFENDRAVLASLGQHLLTHIFQFIANRWSLELQGFTLDRSSKISRLDSRLPRSDSLTSYTRRMSEHFRQPARPIIVFGQMEPAWLPGYSGISPCVRTVSAILLNLPFERLQQLYDVVFAHVAQTGSEGLEQYNDIFQQVVRERQVRRAEVLKDLEKEREFTSSMEDETELHSSGQGVSERDKWREAEKFEEHVSFVVDPVGSTPTSLKFERRELQES